MALNFDVVGRMSAPHRLAYDTRKLALYALSVGANVRGELDYVYEKNMKIIPTYWASILGLQSFVDAYEYGQSIPDSLHYGFEITFHQPMLRTDGEIQYTIQLRHIYDRGEGRGSLAEIEAVAYNEVAEPVFTLATYDIDLSTGGFGGETPPRIQMSYPDRAPDFEIDDQVGPNQSALYRIDNDRNLLHIEPDFAKLGGFDRPMVMGMCTAGYACRALIQALCPQKPHAIQYLRMGFTRVLYPSTNITTQIWNIGENQVYFRLLNRETGEIILNFCSASLGE